MGQNDKNNGPQAHKIISASKKAKRAKEAPKDEVISPWELSEIEKKKKRARGAQSKEVVNGIGSKANKPKGKGGGNWAKEA